jgi:hypothetical protein
MQLDGKRNMFGRNPCVHNASLKTATDSTWAVGGTNQSLSDFPARTFPRLSPLPPRQQTKRRSVNVPSLRVHVVATYTIAGARKASSCHTNALFVAPLALRIDNERRARRRKVADGTENLRRVARTE